MSQVARSPAKSKKSKKSKLPSKAETVADDKSLSNLQKSELDLKDL